ncbi:MAG: GreA/GreB family elongation factor [SAR202 cluster bacterium]|nr:GreA/GreB family elongation factor [SAR202 cluster bacterium]
MESNPPVSLMQAVGIYVASLRSEDSQSNAQQHLMKFVQWCGAERQIVDIRPSEIGEYGEKSVGSTGGAQAVERLQGVRKFLSFAKKKGLTEHNLAQHLRIRKGKSRSLKASGAAEANIVELTIEGHKQLVDELEGLKGERVPIAAEIRRAAADKDVRENVPLEAAREQLGLVEARIRQIESTLKNSVVVQHSGEKAKTVRVGTKVHLKDLGNGRETRYTVVSASEARPLEGKISDVSPVGKALMRRSAGQEIRVDTPRGQLKYRIVKLTS